MKNLRKQILKYEVPLNENRYEKKKRVSSLFEPKISRRGQQSFTNITMEHLILQSVPYGKLF